MKKKIFYSWQADLPSDRNRNFILRSLNDSVKELQADKSLSITPVIDRDTLGVPGSPDIAETIFNKIDECSAFVADVSLINNESPKPTPNPNVLIELGYAVKSIGWKNIILIMNVAYGEPNILPFDLRTKRITKYKVSDDEDKSIERRRLSKIFNSAVKLILNQPEHGLQKKIEISRNKNKLSVIDIERKIDRIEKLSTYSQRDKAYIKVLNEAISIGDPDTAIKYIDRISTFSNRDLVYTIIIKKMIELGQLDKAEKTINNLSTYSLRDEMMELLVFAE